MPQLVAVAVTDLLGEFDHEVAFPADWEYVILYGPNGVGKTKLLEATFSLLHLDLGRLSRLPFRSIDLEFSDGRRLRASKHSQSGFLVEESDPIRRAPSDLIISLFQNDQLVSEFPAGLYRNHDMPFMSWLTSTTNYHQVDEDMWQDISDGEMVEYSELHSRYYQYYRDQRGDDRNLGDIRHSGLPVPPEITDLIASTNIHLIETQRLLSSVRAKPRSIRESTVTRSTVAAFSDDLKRRMRETLAEYSQISQRLDRTLPARVIGGELSPGITDNLIRQKYQLQNERRAVLAEFALIGGESELPLPSQEIEPWKRSVLWMYLADTDIKLETFGPLVDKLTLFRDIVNARFWRKRVVVNLVDGLKIESKNGRDLGVENLSSGEQHELYLIYDLLFNVEAGSTVLIDEPEISLHVAWQRRFLTDLAQVARYASLRFVIATHSPQVINKSWARTVRLGPEVVGGME